MKLVVISPPDEDPREHAALPALFDAGLEHYHLRKPDWPLERMVAWLDRLAERWWPRVVLHSHHELSVLFGLAGRHWPAASAPRTVLPDEFNSRSCHTLDELRASLGHYDRVFLGPVFPSISKPGHGPGESLPHLDLARALTSRSGDAPRRTQVLALGGVDADRIKACRSLGFDGVAVIGAVWCAPDPVAAFRLLQSRLADHAS